jgi:hypothetical protein
MIVLSAANKDGGAHVDEKLTPEYEALAKDGAVGALVYESTDHYREEQIGDAHLVSLKQGFLKKLPASRLDFSQETGAQQAR